MAHFDDVTMLVLLAVGAAVGFTLTGASALGTTVGAGAALLVIAAHHHFGRRPLR